MKYLGVDLEKERTATGILERVKSFVHSKKSRELQLFLLIREEVEISAASFKDLLKEGGKIILKTAKTWSAKKSGSDQSF